MFESEGAKVALEECVGGHRCLKQMLEGKADLATVGDIPIVFNSFQRLDFGSKSLNKLAAGRHHLTYAEASCCSTSF